MKNYLGIDIGGTKIAIVLATENCKILRKIKFQTYEQFSDNLKKIEYEIHKIVSSNIVKISAIGISAGGPLDSEKGIFIAPPHLPNWHNINIKEILEKEFNIPTYLENDANACALAEYYYGNGRSSKNFAFLTFGTGLGVGLIFNGKLYRGSNNQAGELGHVRISDDGPLCFGKKGCVESFCSGAGISLLHEELTGEKVSAKVIFDRAEKEYDKASINTVRISSEKLGLTLSILIDLLSLDRIVIGSIYSRSQKIIDKYMREILNKEILEINRGLCKIEPSYLNENLGDIAAIMVAKQKGIKSE